ncbi:MAG: peptidylprolyl isomerase [Balneolaceae bacterium]
MKQILYASILTLLLASSLFAQSSQVTDRIIAVVNDRIILKSDIDNEVVNYMRQLQQSNQEMEFSRQLWYEVLESMIDNYVLLEKAEIDSVVVSDEIVNRQMDQRINQLIQQAGSEAALERQFGQSIVELRAEFREQFREQMTVQQIRQQKMNEISITRPEVRDFFESIPADSLPTIPEQVALSQIVKIPPPLEDAKEAALERARQIRDSIVVHGKSFEEMARKYSSAPDAQQGGKIPLMPMDQLVPSYSAAAAALDTAEVSGIVETSYGFHIIRLNRRVGDQVDTNNLLISMDDEGMDEQQAIDQLNAIRDSVLNHGTEFAEMARKHSDDEFTGNMGGRILDPQTGQRLLAINQLDPALYRIALLLDETGEISEPRPFNPQNENTENAFRIVRLDRHVQEHVANLDQDYDRIRNIALQQKQMRELTAWLEELRDEIYIEYKIDIPDRYQEPNPELHELQTPVETQ